MIKNTHDSLQFSMRIQLPLMDVTKLFENGHFPYKIVEFTKFSMKQVCKPKKRINSHADVNGRYQIVSISHFHIKL